MSFMRRVIFTLVDWLIAKPIVDILLQIKPGIAGTTVKNALVTDGWLLIAENPNMNEFALIKGYTPEGFSDWVFHLHVRRQGDWDQLLFRDYLVSHPDARIKDAN